MKFKTITIIAFITYNTIIVIENIIIIVFNKIIIVSNKMQNDVYKFTKPWY